MEERSQCRPSLSRLRRGTTADTPEQTPEGLGFLSVWQTPPPTPSFPSPPEQGCGADQAKAFDGGLDELVAPGCQWRIDCNERAPIPRLQRAHEGRDTVVVDSELTAATDMDISWTCTLSRRKLSQHDSIGASIWGHWASHAEKCATEYVSDAYAQLRRRIDDLQQNTVARDALTILLALAGSDFADHYATMHQVCELVRADLPKGSVALVSPSDFRSLANVMDSVCSQFMLGSRCEGSSRPNMKRNAGATEFVTWYKCNGREANSDKFPVVLLVQQAASVPKAVLRDFLNSFGATCIDGGIPMLVVFGLEQPPQDRFELFDGNPLVDVRIIDTVTLFDAHVVTMRLLEHLAEDATCPFALPPRLLAHLRKEFSHACHGVTPVLKILGLLRVQLFSENSFELLCAPVGKKETTCNNSSKNIDKDIQSMFCERLRALPDKFLAKLASSVLSGRVVPEQTQPHEMLVAPLVDAFRWRRRLCTSLALWDELLCAVQPMARHQIRAYRLERLLSQIWPVAGDEAVVVEKQQNDMAKLLDTCLQQLDDNWSRDALCQLVQVLAATSVDLDQDLQADLRDLQRTSHKLERSDFCNMIGAWLQAVMARYWKPLSGLPRLLFIDVFTCDDSISQILDADNGRKSATESLLLPLARGQAHGSESIYDVTLLSRLLECASGRAVDLPSLWRSFEEHACPQSTSAEKMDTVTAAPPSEDCEIVSVTPGPNDPTVLQKRFGQGIFALHTMGLHNPRQSSSRAEKKTRVPFEGWSLKRACFGRAWLYHLREQIKRSQMQVESDLRQPEDKGEQQPVEFNSEEAEPVKPGPAYGILQHMDRNRKGLGLRALEEVGRKARSPDPPAKRQKGNPDLKQRVRLFMS